MNEKWMALPKAFRVSVIYTAYIILPLIILNVLTGVYPWCIYPIFGVLWWPLSAYFAGRRQPLHYALCATGMIWALFLLTYLFASPGAHPWFVYPMMAVFWWPLGVWGAMVGAKKFSVTGALYCIAMLLAINLLTSPQYWWWLFPAAGIIWWPLGVHLPGLLRGKGNKE